MSKRKSKPNFIIDNGIIVSDSKERATLFNNFFHSTFTQSDFVLPSVDRLPSPCVQLSCLEFDEADVYMALVNLDLNKASGCDGINPKLLKYCSTSLTEPIFHLFNLSLNVEYKIPDEWKVHKITPVPKKGNLYDVILTTGKSHFSA